MQKEASQPPLRRGNPAGRRASQDPGRRDTPPLCTTPGTMGAILPGHIHPTIPSRVHPACQPAILRCTGNLLQSGRQALTRALAELTIRHAAVTVTPLPTPVSLLGDVDNSAQSPLDSFGRRGTTRRRLLFRHPPVSLLGNLSYVPDIHLLIRNEAIMRL